MDDGNNGGQRYISIKGMKINLFSSKASGLFTLVGPTVTNSERVLFICILSAKSLSVTDVKGLNYRTYIPYDSGKIMEKNMGEDKAHPGLPVCKFRGKSIPGLICM